MRSLLNSESTSRFSSKSALEGFGTQSFNYERPSSGQSLQIKREDLSPVSKFREENYQATRPSQGTTYKPYSRFITRPSSSSKRIEQQQSPRYEPATEKIITRRQQQQQQQQQTSFSKNQQAYSSPQSRYKTSRFGDDYDNYKTSNRQFESVSSSSLSSKRFSNIPSNKFSSFEPNKSRYAPNFRIEYSDNEDDKVY